MNRPEGAGAREPCERCERPPGRSSSGTDYLCGVGERRITRFTTFTGLDRPEASATNVETMGQRTNTHHCVSHTKPQRRTAARAAQEIDRWLQL